MADPINTPGDPEPDWEDVRPLVRAHGTAHQQAAFNRLRGVAPSPDAPGPHAQPRPEATLIVKAIDALEQDSDQYGALSFLKAALRATTPDRAALAASGDASESHPTKEEDRMTAPLLAYRCANCGRFMRSCECSPKKGRHPFRPGPDPLMCLDCGAPYQSVTRGPDPNHPSTSQGRSTR